MVLGLTDHTASIRVARLVEEDLVVVGAGVAVMAVNTTAAAIMMAVMPSTIKGLRKGTWVASTAVTSLRPAKILFIRTATTMRADLDSTIRIMAVTKVRS